MSIPLWLLLLLHAHHLMTASATQPLLVLSTIDGTTTAIDARTGSPVFTYYDARPTIQSWAAAGVSQYIPSLDGLLYRLNRATGEAHVVLGNFATGVLNPSYDDAAIEILREPSVTLVHLTSGRVVPITASHLTPPLLGKYVMAISRISVRVSIVEVSTKRILANASLAHSVPYTIANERCIVPKQESLRAYMSDSRKHLSVRNSEMGMSLWSRYLPSAVVSIYSVGDVRIEGEPFEGVKSQKNCGPGADVYITKEGKSLYATGTPNDDSSTCKIGFKSHGKRNRKIKKYHIANIADITALRNVDRPFSFPDVTGFTPPSAEERDMWSVIRGLCVLALKLIAQWVGVVLAGHITDKGLGRIGRMFRS